MNSSLLLTTAILLYHPFRFGLAENRGLSARAEKTILRNGTPRFVSIYYKRSDARHHIDSFFGLKVKLEREKSANIELILVCADPVHQ